MTHEVFNQPEPLTGYYAFETNRPLRDALRFNAPALDTAELHRLGQAVGSEEMQTHARLANVHTPELHTHDRFGRRHADTRAASPPTACRAPAGRR